MAEEKKKKTPPTEVLDDDFDDEDEVDEEEDEVEEENEDEDLEVDDIDEEEPEEEVVDKKDHDDGKKEKGNQSKEERARQAQARRDREAKEREAREKEIEKKAYLKGKLDSTKVNTYTEEPIEDEYDLFIFETQKQLEKEGKDPISDLPKRLAEINRENDKKAKEEAEKKKKQDEKIDQEFAEFHSKYPDVSIPELLKDPDFADYADGRLGMGAKTLTQLYEGFMKMKNKFSGAKTEKEEEDDGKATPPSPNGGRKHEKTSYSKMSEEEKVKELRRQGLIN